MASRAPRTSRVLGIAALAALGLLAAHATTLPLAGWLARGAGEGLAEVAASLRAAPAADIERAPSVEALQALSGASPVDFPGLFIPGGLFAEQPLERRKAPSSGRRARVGSPPEETPLGIMVRESVVRAAVARGGQPSGTPIGPEGDRPAGLVLAGVSAYGSALRDGDILTRVGGTPATSAGRVIGAVSGALRSGARAIDGEVWRGLRRIPVVVELPKLEGRKARKKKSRRREVSGG